MHQLWHLNCYPHEEFQSWVGHIFPRLYYLLKCLFFHSLYIDFGSNLDLQCYRLIKLYKEVWLSHVKPLPHVENSISIQIMTSFLYIQQNGEMFSKDQKLFAQFEIIMENGALTLRAPSTTIVPYANSLDPDETASHSNNIFTNFEQH